MAAAPLPRRAVLLSLLAAAVLAQASPDEPAAVEAALSSDDHCAAGGAVCALNALQRRGASLAADADTEAPSLLSEAAKEGSIARKRSSRRRRRRHSQHATSTSDMTAQGEESMKGQVKKIWGHIQDMEKSLKAMETMVNSTYKSVSGRTGDSDKKAGKEEEAEDSLLSLGGDLEALAKHDSLLEEGTAGSSPSRRRRHSTAPPRMSAVQTLVDNCRKEIDKTWKKLTRDDRLTAWIEAKIHQPDAPDWEEPDADEDEEKDDEDEGLLLAQHSPKWKNRLDASMQKTVDELDREVARAEKEVKRVTENAKSVQAMWKKGKPMQGGEAEEGE